MAELKVTDATGEARGTKPVGSRISTDVIDAVEVMLEAVVGSASITVAELTKLKANDVLPLDAQLNAPVELRLNGKSIARGELVAVGDNFAVRLTEIAS